jgi:hypothetical protein
MIAYLFLVPTSKKLMEGVMAPPKVCLFLPYKQPKNLESVITTFFFAIACSKIIIVKYSYAKSSQYKSTSYVVVHEVGRNV